MIIKPTRDHVLLKKAPLRQDGPIIRLEGTKAGEGIVLAIGPESKLSLHIGDRVLIGANGANFPIFMLQGEPHVVLRDTDLLAILPPL